RSLVSRRTDDNAGAEGDEVLPSFDDDRVRERPLDVLHHGRRVAQRSDLLHQNRELVAAHTGDGPGGTRSGPAARREPAALPPGAPGSLLAAGEPLRDLFQDAVPQKVAQTVVDVLESIHVEEDDGQAVLALALARPLERLPQSIEKERAIRQAGHRI